MAYCTKTDLIEAVSEAVLIELTDDAEAGVVDDSCVTEAITYAGNLIDIYLKDYALPFTQVPPVLEGICVDIALHWLYGRRMNAEWKERYDEAMRYLRDIASGKASLIVEGSDDSPNARAAGGLSWNAI